MMAKLLCGEQDPEWLDPGELMQVDSQSRMQDDCYSIWNSS